MNVRSSLHVWLFSSNFHHCFFITRTWSYDYITASTVTTLNCLWCKPKNASKFPLLHVDAHQIKHENRHSQWTANMASLQPGAVKLLCKYCHCGYQDVKGGWGQTLHAASWGTQPPYCHWTPAGLIPDMSGVTFDVYELHFHCVIQDSGKKADFIVHDDRSLLAVQGPAAHDALQPLLKDLDLNSFYFSNFAILDIAGIPCWLTRTG